jgi:hypothetical protein
MMICKRQYTGTNIKGRMVKCMIYFIELMNKYNTLLIGSSFVRIFNLSVTIATKACKNGIGQI